MNYDLIIVDDETIMLEGLTQFINWKELGFNVKQSFSNGESALEYLKNEKVDVVLTDIQMDHVSGIDIAEFIHEHKLKVKVIF
ncbi:MAG: response regulator, partial [Spirochaetales bacterium]|nr:response regulator [Spirochaetales bacterium]